MSTKDDRDLEDELGPSPHPAFADREEPWTDHELMLKLDERHDYQYEIAHVLGCSSSKVSYWLQKAKEWRLQQGIKTGAICQRCEDSKVPGGAVTGNSFCETCLDEVRLNQSNREHPV